MVAQALIGPALVPGLMAAGLVVLAVGSVRLIGESLDFSEVVGIVLLIAGIVLLGLSELEISVDVVRERLGDPGTATRVAVLTVSLFVLWAATHLQAMRLSRRKGIVMAFSNGFPFAISNFWISPLLAVGAVVLAGDGSWGQTGLFVLASVILVSCNVLGIRQTNEAFKWAQASNVIPVQQLSVQVTPSSSILRLCPGALHGPPRAFSSSRGRPSSSWPPSCSDGDRPRSSRSTERRAGCSGRKEARQFPGFDRIGGELFGVETPPVTYATVPPTATQGRVTARGYDILLGTYQRFQHPAHRPAASQFPLDLGDRESGKARSVRRRLNRTRLLAICFGVVIRHRPGCCAAAQDSRN